ncbi:uncharacterized protein [Euwallacea fornicatus]|uniref:uncharacterized protein n=1 Tax=Euwallacea fornicatus TaxID=995702 RepID=UPI00338F9176
MASGSNSASPILTSEVGFTVPNRDNSEINEDTTEASINLPKGQLEVLLKKMLELPCNTGPSEVISEVKLPNFDPKSPMADPEGWCCLTDEFVNVHKLSGIRLATSLSNALKGEAADWLIRCRPLGKHWGQIRLEFLSSFSKPTDLLELFNEAVNGQQNCPSDATLLDEGLHVLRLALHLIKTRESDEALATLFACHVVANRSEAGSKRLQADMPKNLQEFCVALRGTTAKRPALVRADPHISPKSRAFAPTPSKKNSRSHFPGSHFLWLDRSQSGTLSERKRIEQSP